MTETANILLLHGTDEFAIAAHIEKLCAGLGDPATADMNISRFDGRLGLDYQALHAAVNAMPFLAPRRVMVLVNPISAFNSAETRKKFLDFLEQAQPTTTIALAEYDELKRDHWLMKWAAGAAPRTGIHVYNMPKRWEMPRWIESETKKLGGKIEPDAAAHLAEMDRRGHAHSLPGAAKTADLCQFCTAHHPAGCGAGEHRHLARETSLNWWMPWAWGTEKKPSTCSINCCKTWRPWIYGG